jgi:hypothetical protein
MLRFCAAFFLFCCSISNTHAVPPSRVVERVIAVLPNGQLQLEHTGNAVLADVVFPSPESASIWLSEYALQRETTLTVGKEDRYGRVLVRGQLQQDMLNDGAAIFYTTDTPIDSAWRMAEARARSKKYGVWSDPNIALVINPNKAANHHGRFALIEGAITRIYEGKTGTYLNFGEDWHEDFSIAISPKLRRSMKVFLANLKAGDRVRVRGTIVQENGPMIRLNHADNLEKL